MKVPIDGYSIIDLDAPTLPAGAVNVNGATRWRVWCRYCNAWHSHGPGDGHREAHCDDSRSPYSRSGYNLALDGRPRLAAGDRSRL